MSRNKQMRFRENEGSANVIEPGKEIYQTIKGNWRKCHFKNDHPIILELACGNGEYSVGLGKLYPKKNFIGVDIKGARIWRGSTDAKSEGLENVAFLRTKIQMIENFFEPDETDEIWIVFPDPRPKDSDERRRLTSPRFLDIYKNIMKKKGIVHLKTDNGGLYNYSLEIIEKREDIRILARSNDLYRSEFLSLHHDIRTKYEQMFSEEGNNIKYLQFQFK